MRIRRPPPIAAGFLLVVLLALALGSGPAFSQAVQGIAVVVNDDIVSTQALADRMRLVRASTDLPDDAETQRRLTQQVLRALIDETLQRQEARRLNIQVEAGEVDEALAQIAQRNGLSVAQLAQFLAERGARIDALRAQIESQIAWLKIMARRVRPRVLVTEEQVDLALRVGGPGTATGEVRLSEIVLPVYDAAQEADVMNGARQLVEALRGGSQFEALARQVSTSPTADSGGDLGWVPLGAMAADVRAAIATLEPGQISDPIRAPTGVLILKVNEVRDSGVTPVAANPDRERMRQRLVDEQTQRLASRYLRDLRRDAFIDVRL